MWESKTCLHFSSDGVLTTSLGTLPVAGHHGKPIFRLNRNLPSCRLVTLAHVTKCPPVPRRDLMLWAVMIAPFYSDPLL